MSKFLKIVSKMRLKPRPRSDLALKLCSYTPHSYPNTYLPYIFKLSGWKESFLPQPFQARLALLQFTLLQQVNVVMAI